jgi:hypothetical protein
MSIFLKCIVFHSEIFIFKYQNIHQTFLLLKIGLKYLLRAFQLVCKFEKFKYVCYNSYESTLGLMHRHIAHSHPIDYAQVLGHQAHPHWMSTSNPDNRPKSGLHVLIPKDVATHMKAC